MRCRYCGRNKDEAYRSVSYTCSPPFTVRTHVFDGQHPADIRERELAKRNHDPMSEWWKAFALLALIAALATAVCFALGM